MQGDLDLRKMEDIVHDLYTVEISREYGVEGQKNLRPVLQGIRSVFDYVEPESINSTLIIFRSLDDDDNILGFLPSAIHFRYAEYLAQEYDSASRKGAAAIQLLSNDEYRLWKDVSIDLNRLCANSIVYVYGNREEYFFVRGRKVSIPNPSRAHASIFAIPTFRRLRDALEDYKRRTIRTSQCKIFSQVWDGGERSDRLFFTTKPEAKMRNSLWQYLSNVLGAEVRPEQIVDESHPCDIKVTWMKTNRLALIEIKWLGKSINSDGHISQNFTESRAREGAKQLADYLDANRTQTPTHQTKGYLVVIDGRRRNLSPGAASINQRYGYWYRDREIVFSPEYHNERHDFEEPIRMFVEPICRPG